LPKNVNSTGNLTCSSVRQWIEGRSRPLNVQRLDRCTVSQNGWRAGSRGWLLSSEVCYQQTRPPPLPSGGFPAMRLRLRQKVFGQRQRHEFSKRPIVQSAKGRRDRSRRVATPSRRVPVRSPRLADDPALPRSRTRRSHCPIQTRQTCSFIRDAREAARARYDLALLKTCETAASSRHPRIFSEPDDNYPFTMPTIPQARWPKSSRPQVPLYHWCLVMVVREDCHHHAVQASLRKSRS